MQTEIHGCIRHQIMNKNSYQIIDHPKHKESIEVYPQTYTRENHRWKNVTKTQRTITYHRTWQIWCCDGQNMIPMHEDLKTPQLLTWLYRIKIFLKNNVAMIDEVNGTSFCNFCVWSWQQKKQEIRVIEKIHRAMVLLDAKINEYPPMAQTNIGPFQHAALI